MVKISEPEIKIVMTNMRKWLIRMSQTAMVVGGSSTLYGPAIDILLGRHQEVRHDVAEIIVFN